MGCVMNDLELYDSGEIQPYREGLPVLAPLSPAPDTWGRTDLTPAEQHHQPQGPTLFGAALPAAATPQHVQTVLAELGGLFLSDFTKLNYPSHLIQSSIAFFMDNATKTPRQVTAQHYFNLPNELKNDYLAVLFANHLEGLSGTKAQKQQFLNASLQWLDKLNKRLGSQHHVETQAHGSAPQSTEAILNSLSDADYAKVVQINNDAKAKTMASLAAKYGDYSVQQVVEIGQKYLESLPANERAHFDQFTTGWVHSLNTVEVLEALYGMAIGANSLPNNGADIAREIASIEYCMKYERKKYLADPQLQARYRTLLQLKG